MISALIKKSLVASNKRTFGKSVSRIRETKPISCRQDDAITVVSMVGKDTLLMYLLAIKSFMSNFGYGKIEVINDGSLGSEEIDTLQYHVPGVRISDASDVETHGCPSYISWKRLFKVQQLAQESYVIQLDSDTVSLAPLVDVDERVRANKGFVIGSKRWSQGVDVSFLRNVVNNWSTDHPQTEAERNFHKLEFFQDGTKYLRGCAGFAGYPKNFASVEEIQALSGQIERHVGEKWYKWGSEQTATLCLISKCKGSTILPWPYYQNYRFPESSEVTSSMNFVHFIGTSRFSDRCYQRLADLMIERLLKGGWGQG